MKTKQDISTKPYYRCFICPDFRNTCGGRPTRDMDLQTWCEYMRDIRDFFHMSNAYITEKADGSISTTERIMAINVDKDILRSTARRYELAIIGPVGTFTCHFDNNQSATAAQIETLQAEIAALREDAAYWRKENDRKAKLIDRFLDV